jgi:GNAT superfamily N-acetyltransferase
MSLNVTNKLSFEPLSITIWKSLLELFGENGACGGCWCMTWRLLSKEYEKNKGAHNRELFYQLVKNKEPVGVIAFDYGKPIGWCSISPREKLIRLENSRLFKRMDDTPVWSITCMFIKKEYRKKGISPMLIKEASKYAFLKGATVIEAYPVLSTKNKMIPDVFAYYGLVNAFKDAGFKKVKQASENRLIMRLG